MREHRRQAAGALGVSAAALGVRKDLGHEAVVAEEEEHAERELAQPGEEDGLRSEDEPGVAHALAQHAPRDARRGLALVRRGELVLDSHGDDAGLRLRVRFEDVYSCFQEKLRNVSQAEDVGVGRGASCRRGGRGGGGGGKG